MQNVVYSYGGGEALFQVLNGVAMIFKHDITKTLFQLMTFFGLSWAAVQGALQNSWMPKLNWVTKYVLITSFFITPTVTLWVSDSVSGYKRSVDDLPIGLVLPASIFSGIGFGITHLFDQAFSKVDNNIPYHKYGQSFGAALISQARNFKIQDAGFRENMESFIDNCMLHDVMIGRKYSSSDMRDSANLWGLVKRSASNIRRMNYRDVADSGNRKLVSCKVGAGLLDSYWNTDLDKLGKKFGSTIFGKYGNSISSTSPNQTFLGTAFRTNVNVVAAMYGNSGRATENLKQIMMINALADIPMNYGAVRAKQQQQESWLVSGQLAREILPTLHAIFAALIYASFTLIIGMLVLPNGFRTLANYLGLLIWIETWPPLFAVLNLLTNISGKTFGGNFNEMTMNNFSQIVNHNNNISVVASGMMMVLPYLSYNILKGGAGQFVHLASQVMGSSQSAAMAASTEVTSGNRSLDNVSMLNSQWSNNSGFKTDLNTSFKAGQREHQLADGTIVKEMADGHKIMQSGPGITHSTGAKSMHMAFSQSSQDHQSLSEEQASTISKRKEYDAIEQAAYKKVVELADRMTGSEISGEHYSDNHTTGVGKTLNQEVGTSKDLHGTYSYNNNQATEMTFKGHVGGDLSKSFGASSASGGEKTPQGIFNKVLGSVGASLNVGLDLSGSGRKENINSQGLSEDQSASAKATRTKLIEDVARAAKETQFTESQSKERALADSIVGSYERMETLRNQIEVSEQKTRRYQTSIDNSQSSVYTVTDDTYHKRLDFMAEQKDRNGFNIGFEKAKKIIDEDGPENKKYHQAFQAKYLPQQKMLTPNSNYEKDVKDNIPQSDMRKDYAAVKEHSNSVMEARGGVTQDAKVKVNQQHKSDQNEIQSGEYKILQKGEQLQTNVDKEAESSTHWYSPGEKKETGKKFDE